jgi:rubredoxin
LILANLDFDPVGSAGVTLLCRHMMLRRWNGFKGAAAVAEYVLPQGEPGDREPKLARRSPFAPEARLCPKCLGPLRSVNRDLIGFVPQEYYCPKCGYSGSVYVVKDRDIPQGSE